MAAPGKEVSVDARAPIHPRQQKAAWGKDPCRNGRTPATTVIAAAASCPNSGRLGEARYRRSPSSPLPVASPSRPTDGEDGGFQPRPSSHRRCRLSRMPMAKGVADYGDDSPGKGGPSWPREGCFIYDVS